MSNYQGVNLQISNLISELEVKNINSLKNKLELLEIDVNVKEENDLYLISNKFSKKNINKISEIERECRSLILDKNLNIVCYSYDDIYYNQDAKGYILKNGLEKNYTIQECFEGTLMSVFNFNGEWFLSTRQCIDAKNSKWTSEKSYYEMFMECIGISFKEFTNHLKEDNNYFFVIVHCDNKNIVDYSEYFKDENYKKIIHVMTRNRQTNEEIELDNETQWNLKPNFEIPKKIKIDEDGSQVFEFIDNSDNLTLNYPDVFENFNKLDNTNKQYLLTLPVKTEGVIVRYKSDENGKLTLMKFQTNSYQFMSLLKPNTNNIFMSFIELYQQDLLKKHIEYFPGNSKMVIDDISENYDTIGVVDATFKVLTSELYEIFKHLYDLKDCSHKNENFYKILPTEYTIALYKIRGIYYRKKEKFIKSKLDNSNEPNNYTYSLKIFDIYNLLKKKYDTKDLLKLLRARKLIMHQYFNDTTPYGIILNNISSKCDKVSIKMTSILLNKMFPKDPELEVYSKSDIKKESYGLSQSI